MVDNDNDWPFGNVRECFLPLVVVRNDLNSLAIRLRSEDLHHLILGNGVPE